MTIPRRIQRSRQRGWKMPAGAVYVGRPGRWGNPYRPGPAFECRGVRVPALTAADAVQLYREHLERALAWPSVRADLAQLRGRDLVCWCALDQPCHADVLLEMANAAEADNA